MAFIPLPTGAKAVIHQALDNQICLNDLWFALPSGAPTLSEVQALAVLVDAWFSGAILPYLNEGLAYGFTTVQAWDVVNGFTADVNTSAGIGGITGEAAPNNVSPCVSFRTGMAGRSFRGRNYIAGVSNSDILGNTIDTGWATTIVNGYNFLLPGGVNDPAPFVWSVASFFTANLPRLTGIATPITSVIFTDSIVDSQRRRLPGRGK